MILPLVGALTLFAAQGAWGWISDKVSDPPELEVYSAGPDGCAPRYSESSLSELKTTTAEAAINGVPVTDAHFDPVEIPLTLQAKADEAIVVTGIKVRTLSDRKLPTRGVIVEPTGCGGGMTKREFDVKFGSVPVSVRPHVSRYKDGATRTSADFPFKISKSDPEQLSLYLFPGDRDVRFSVEVQWVSGGNLGSETLDNDGQGYRVMGPGGIPTFSMTELSR